ncbi:MAG: hypothetical protein R2695_14850, partial [Acidimicrobiales bacterium]
MARELLDNDAVSSQLADNIGKALEAAIPSSIPLTDEQVAVGVQAILADPGVRELLVGSLAASHRAFLGLDQAPSEIDLGPALAAGRDRIGAVAPTFAEQIPETLAVDLPTEHIPNASPIRRLLERAVPILALLSLFLVGLAFLTTSDRAKVLGRAARWAIGTTAVYLIMGLGVPALLRRVAPDQAEVVAALLTALLRAVIVPSIVLGAVGAGLLALSMFWPDATRHRHREAAPPRTGTSIPSTTARPAAYPGPATRGADPTAAFTVDRTDPIRPPAAAVTAPPSTGRDDVAPALEPPVSSAPDP